MNDPEKEIDLHESEWHRDGKREPILGPNGLYFLVMFALAFPVGYVATIIVEFVWSLL